MELRLISPPDFSSEDQLHEVGSAKGNSGGPCTTYHLSKISQKGAFWCVLGRAPGLPEKLRTIEETLLVVLRIREVIIYYKLKYCISLKHPETSQQSPERFRAPSGNNSDHPGKFPEICFKSYRIVLVWETGMLYYFHFKRKK